LGGPVDVGPARVGQLQQAGDLVVGLPGGIVDGVAEGDHVGGQVVDQQQRGVPTRDQQCDHGFGQRPVFELVDCDVADEMVDAVEGLSECHGVGLGGRETHQQRAGESGAGGEGDGVDVVLLHTRGVEGASDGGDHGFQVGAAGDLGYDTTEADVLVDAGGDFVTQQFTAAHQTDA